MHFLNHSIYFSSFPFPSPANRESPSMGSTGRRDPRRRREFRRLRLHHGRRGEQRLKRRRTVMTMTTKSMEIGICLQIRPFIAPEKKTDIRHIFFFKKKTILNVSYSAIPSIVKSARNKTIPLSLISRKTLAFILSINNFIIYEGLGDWVSCAHASFSWKLRSFQVM